MQVIKNPQECGQAVKVQDILSIEQSRKTMRTSFLSCIFFFSLHYFCVKPQRITLSSFFFSAPTDSECQGSVTLYSNVSEDEVVFEDSDIWPRMKVTKVLVEGCGCFTLHSRKKGRGKSFFLARQGEFEVNMKVGSVMKVSCGP